jgi:hypothetical protein
VCRTRHGTTPRSNIERAQEKAQAHASLEGALKDAQDALAAETAKREAAEADAAGKLAQGQQDRDYWRDRQAAQDKEIKDLLVRLAKSDQERAALTHQVRASDRDACASAEGQRR